MESRFNRGKQEQEMNDQDGHQISFAEAYSNAKDWGKDFRTLINHKPIENLDIENLEQALLDTQLTSSNIGYRLLQKMRWKGRGLGKDKQVSQLHSKSRFLIQRTAYAACPTNLKIIDLYVVFAIITALIQDTPGHGDDDDDINDDDVDGGDDDEDVGNKF